jgi:hypothetical protein
LINRLLRKKTYDSVAKNKTKDYGERGAAFGCAWNSNLGLALLETVEFKLNAETVEKP